MMTALDWIGETAFAVWVKPRARQNQVVGVREGALQVALTAPPVEGQANEALVRYLARTLGVRQKQVEIVSGERSRHKVVRIHEITPEELRRRVDGALLQR